MHLIELLLIAVGLSMDAFAVAVCLGLSMKQATIKKALTVGLYFGIFQMGMPLIGYALAYRFADYITAYDHWLAFILLCLIGGNMIRESFKCDDGGPIAEAPLGPRRMIPFAFATSVDALAVGVTFAFLQVEVLSATGMIGVTTLLLSMAGVKVGHVFGIKIKSRAELAGGVILVLMGARILLEHNGII